MATFTVPAANQQAFQGSFCGTTPGTGDINAAYAALAALVTGNVQNTAYAGGARGDGSHDDTAAINAAIAAGGVTVLPPGNYMVSSTITLPANATIIGAGMGPTGTWIKPTSGFSGTAVFELASGVTMHSVRINGSSGPAGVNGIHGNGVASFRAIEILIEYMTNNGISFTQVTDSTLVNVDCRYNGASGFALAQCANTRLLGCQAEWNTQCGYINTQTTTGTGSGGTVFSGCTSDRNGQSGFRFTGTGTAPMNLSGCSARRDNSTSASGHGGFSVSGAGYPVVMDGITVFPGVNDDGSGTNTPPYGLVLASSADFVSVTGAMLHAATGGVSSDGTVQHIFRSVWVRTGTTASPTAPYPAADDGLVTPTGDTTGASDTACLGAALAAAAAGQAVTLAPGVYYLTSGLTVPAQVTLTGVSVSLNPSLAGAVLKPVATFSGSAVLTAGSGAVIRHVGIDGSASPASVSGISGGTAVGAVLEYVYIKSVTNVGLDVSAGARGWHVSHVKIDGVGAQGVACSGHSDGTWSDVHVIGSVGHGWSIAGSVPNSRFTNCRAEWAGSGKNGFHLTGTWSSGAGSGGVSFTGCSTDRNDNNGFSINVTGTMPITLDNCTFRRDGRNGNAGGSTYAGLVIIATTAPVLVSNCSVFPGVDDDGTGTNSPAYGLYWSGTSTLVALSNCLFHANTGGVGGTPSGQSYRNVWTRTGSTSAPTAPSLTADTA